MRVNLLAVISSFGLILGLLQTSIIAQSLPKTNNQNINSAQVNLQLPDSVYNFNPVADATIRQDFPDINYGSLTAIHTDNSPIKNFLIKFNITGVNNRQVLNASLRLYNEDSSSVGGYFHFVPDSSWDEGTVTWNNAPAQDPFVYALLDLVSAGNWYEVDLTSLIIGDGYYTLRVTSTTSNGADYTSREGINPPELILTVSNNAASTATLTPINSPTSTLSPTPTNTPTTTLTPTQTFTPAPSATPLPNGHVRFAVIGDYGTGGQREGDVATLVKSWNPDFIVTTGDNNYSAGGTDTIDDRVGQFYHEYIYPYSGSFGAGANSNRFFPSLGNHDWGTGSIQDYLDYFTLPNNERYYDFVWGSLHFFILDSDSLEPDGVTATSVQASWLQTQLKNSSSAWDIVVLHHSPYSSSEHGSELDLQWPYKEWGANVVLSAHDHAYERLLVNSLPYIVNGLGGGSIYTFNTPIPGSQVRYNEDYGALLGEANSTQLTFKFYSRSSVLVDTYTINVSTPPTSTTTYTPSPTPTQTASNTPTATFTPTNTATATQTPSLTPSITPTFTSTSSFTPTQTPSNTPTATYTPIDTFTPTRTPSLTSIPTSTFMPTASFTPTWTPSNTPTATQSPTSTFTPSQTPSNTPTATYTATHTSTPTNTSTQTSTPATLQTIFSRIESSDDDAEERISNGRIYLTSTDMELGEDRSRPQIVALRFNNISIPQGATITNAYIEFEVDETGSDPTSVTFFGQDSDNAAVFTNTIYDISSRPESTARVDWNNIPPWTTVSAKVQTPDLSPIISEIVNRPQWSAGNALVITARGTGRRTAESYNGESANAALLVITYSIP